MSGKKAQKQKSGNFPQKAEEVATLVVRFVRKFGEKNITFIFGSLIATDIIQFIIRKSCLFILTSS